MARNRASMREGPLAELFRATEAAQKQGRQGDAGSDEPAQQQLPTEPEAEAPATPPTPTTRMTAR